MNLGRLRLGRHALLALVAVILVSCSASERRTDEEAFDTSRAERMFVAGYQDVTSVYIKDVATADLAMAGLRGLSAVDPEFSAVRSDGQVSIAVGEHEVGRYLAPSDNDNDGWAEVTARAIADGRAHSPALGKAEAEALYEAVFDGLVTRLDTYSRYAGRDEAREHRASRDGFGGIGVRIRMVERGVHVISVMDDTPAARAGLRANDIIVAIDGETAKDLSQRDVVRRLRGPVDSRVVLSVERENGGAAFPVKVLRSHIVPQTVSYRREGNAAVFKVTSFNQSTSRALRDAMARAQREIGPLLSGYVLDLRGNPGGLLDQAVAVSDLFLERGRIVSTHGRHPDSHQYFEAHRDALADEIATTVLINGNSASASEIVAAALQDSRRAIVIGSNSFGKGTVQTVLRLPNEGELTLTWARFHAPSGYTLNHRGVLPDICTSTGVHSAADVIDRLNRGTMLAPLADARQALRTANDDDTALAALRDRCPTRDAEEEIDLRVALDLLQDPVLFGIARGAGTLPATAHRSGQVSELSTQ